jgi:hypothetical protein
LADQVGLNPMDRHASVWFALHGDDLQNAGTRQPLLPISPLHFEASPSAFDSQLSLPFFVLSLSFLPPAAGRRSPLLVSSPSSPEAVLIAAASGPSPQRGSP